MDNKDLIIETMTKQNVDLTALVQTLTKSNADLTETIKELQETIRELQRQLNQNSQNSSKPPSSDGFNKPKPQSLRQKSGKKQGGQKGNPGAHMSIPHEPDEYRKHLPEK
jgi:chromosome segregation ATPase